MTEQLEKLRDKVRTSDIIALAYKTKLHYNTLYRFASGKHSNLTVETIKKLEAYFNESTEN